LRTYYPFAREADDAADVALQCVGGNPRQKPAQAKKCAEPLTASISAIRSRMPSDSQLQGCAHVVATATVAAIDSLKQRAEHGGIWDTGIEFADFHGTLEPCAKMFLCGPPKEPCTPAGLEGHLGLRDDEAPGASSFARHRMGNLWVEK
jgi:hypothetical protein